MSDLFKFARQPEEFRSFRHFRDLCLGDDVRFRTTGTGKFSYHQGWKALVERFIHELKAIKNHVVLNDIVDDFGELNISFVGHPLHEEKVWRLINDARIASRETCIECGGQGTRMVHGRRVTVMCQACLRKSKTEGNRTGTWLDEF